MGMLDLLYVASMPVLKVLIIAAVGAGLATQYAGVLTSETLHSLNKIVFVVFTPAFLFQGLVQSVTFQDIISWWSMPVNVVLTYIIGSILGWLVIKISKTPKELHGIVISNCCAGNLGILLVIVIPNLCLEKGNPFGDTARCRLAGTSYVSFSMALGGVLSWTYAYSLMKSSIPYSTNELEEGLVVKVQSVEDFASSDFHCPEKHVNEDLILVNKSTLTIWSEKLVHGFANVWQLIFHELKSPPNIGVVSGFFIGAIPPIKSLFVGETAPLHVIQGAISLMGDGTIPSCTLILGGNLLKGLKHSRLKFGTIPLVLCARFIVMPMAGIFIVKGASHLGLLPDDPLYKFVLMIQYSVPPAMALGTIAQLFSVGEQECSVLFFWTYLTASIAVTFWSTVFMSLLVNGL